MTRPPPPTLALAVAALIAVIAPAMLLWPEDVPAAPPMPALTPLRPVPVPPIIAELVAPLFDASRNPPPPPAPVEPAAAAPAPLTPPVLVGVATRPGGGVALVRRADGTTITVAIGAEVEGWRLLDVTNGSARFAAGEQQESVALDFRNKSAGAAAVSGSPTASTPSSAASAQPTQPAAPLAEPRPSRPR